MIRVTADGNHSWLVWDDKQVRKDGWAKTVTVTRYIERKLFGKARTAFRVGETAGILTKSQAMKKAREALAALNRRR